ncbi:MAG TPA: hypothetical protein VJA21_16480 [Verrucomicrobiae bacterium]
MVACLWAVLMMSGAQWFALQSFAWVRMTITFAQRDSLGTALSKTFSGLYPCPLCVKAQTGWHEDNQAEKEAPLVRVDNLPEALWEVRCLTVPPAPRLTWTPGAYASDFYFDFSVPPPFPPPRA